MGFCCCPKCKSGLVQPDSEGYAVCPHCKAHLRLVEVAV